MRHSDKPILKPSQDVLGRAGFAFELARAIDRLTVAKEGFVIAILGDWGSGKTSVIELVARFLRDIEMERISAGLGDDRNGECSVQQLEEMAEIYERVEDHVKMLEASTFNLNYWQRAQRIEDFRAWLGSEYDAERAQRYWQLKFLVDANPRTVVVRFSPWMIAGRAELAIALLSELARALGEKLGDEVREAFAALLQRLSELLPVAGAAIDLAAGVGIGKLLAAGGKWSKAIAARMSTGPTIDALRTQLRSILSKLDDRRVLVIVDDLDRLTPPEALEMVSLVKSLGDLPNVIYMLAYDEIKLAELINVTTNVDGSDYLEKIIQYPVHLPTIANQDLIRLLDADLTAVLGNLTPREQSRLGVTWHQVFRHYLRTPRDVRRYINSLAVSVSALGEHLDKIDLITLELLRLYEPNVYWWLRQHLDEVVQ